MGFKNKIKGLLELGYTSFDGLVTGIDILFNIPTYICKTKNGEHERNLQQLSYYISQRSASYGFKTGYSIGLLADTAFLLETGREISNGNYLLPIILTATNGISLFSEWLIPRNRVNSRSLEQKLKSDNSQPPQNPQNP